MTDNPKDPDKPAAPTLLTTGELAKTLSVNRRTIMRYCRLGILPPPIIINSRSHRYDLDECLAALKERTNNMLREEVDNVM